MSEQSTQKTNAEEAIKKPNPTVGLIRLLGNYKLSIAGVLFFLFASNGINLFIPQIISNSIDTYRNGSFNLNNTLIAFTAAAIGIFIFTFIQSIFQTYVAESIARNLRNELTAKISRLSYLRVQELGPSTLLTNLTSDIDNVKSFVLQGVGFFFTAIILLIGASAFLFSINWKLALAVLAIMPLIFITFVVVFKNIGDLFSRSQGIIDRINKVLTENITASALVRVLNSGAYELKKFTALNEESKSVGMSILKMFVTVFPIITFLANMTSVVILLLGGYFVINNEMTLGQFSAFLNYVGLLIFPVIILGFLSQLIGRAATSYGRILEVIESKEDAEAGGVSADIKGNIEFKNINLNLANRGVLKNISFSIPAGSRTAILGPTAAGKTQIFYLLAKLLYPENGEILIDNIKLGEFENESLYKQMGLVFQDSVIFNTSIKENIAFTTNVSDEDIQKAIQTAELNNFIDSLPDGLNTIVSERGASLSGGQKQRITLARALTLNPKILLLDDFTARVDNNTEKRIFENIKKNYPNLTLILITQKISSVQDFDKILLLVEGELLAQGKHNELMENSLDYQQIYQSQLSTEKGEEN